MSCVKRIMTFNTVTVLLILLMPLITPITNVHAASDPSSTGTLSTSTITSILNGFNPVIGPIPTTSYSPPSGCTMPQSSTIQGTINKVQCGLYASDPLNNETKSQQQLQTSPRYWTFGGDSISENAPYAFYKDTGGLHIAVQAPS